MNQFFRTQQPECDPYGRKASTPGAKLICDKQRNGEWEGSIGLWFDKASMQYVGSAGDEPLLMYRHPEDF